MKINWMTILGNWKKRIPKMIHSIKRIVHYIKFYQFLNVRGYMKEIPFKPEYYLKKTYPEHHDRTVEEKSLYGNPA